MEDQEKLINRLKINDSLAALFAFFGIIVAIIEQELLF